MLAETGIPGGGATDRATGTAASDTSTEATANR
jgi:hypothetical protein